MFTGIVQGKAKITHIHDKQDLKTLTVQFPANSLKNISRGASVALNGACLTVTNFDTDTSTANFDVINQTLEITNLSSLEVGDQTNFERAARIGDEIGGHLMSGHIFQTITLLETEEINNKFILKLALTEKLKPYIFDKGFVGLNGCSLTIAKVSATEFEVHLIPETLEITTFKHLKAGAQINLEIDPQTQAVVDTVNKYMAQQQKQ